MEPFRLLTNVSNLWMQLVMLSLSVIVWFHWSFCVLMEPVSYRHLKWQILLTASAVLSQRICTCQRLNVFRHVALEGLLKLPLPLRPISVVTAVNYHRMMACGYISISMCLLLLKFWSVTWAWELEVWIVIPVLDPGFERWALQSQSVTFWRACDFISCVILSNVLTAVRLLHRLTILEASCHCETCPTRRRSDIWRREMENFT